MTKERRDLLEKLGFKWVVRESEGSLSWDERLKQLRQYKAEYGNCQVPRSYTKNCQLGSWVHYQRQQYRLMMKGQRSQMTSERVTQLESEQFVWNMQGHRPFEVRLEQLRQYKEQHGHCQVPIKWSENPQLGNWVHNQRKEYKRYKLRMKSTLTPVRIQMMESAGFVWDTRIQNSSSSVNVTSSVQRPVFYPNSAIQNAISTNEGMTQTSSEQKSTLSKVQDSTPNLEAQVYKSKLEQDAYFATV